MAPRNEEDPYLTTNGLSNGSPSIHHQSPDEGNILIKSVYSDVDSGNATIRTMEQPNDLIFDTSLSEIQGETDLAKIWTWNKLVPESIESCVHKMIEEMVKKQPDAPAISAWDGELTYGELDKYASHLASQLRTLGACPDMVVPLCFEKSMWTTVAMLAVMKSGGGFVLLDTNLPEQRLRDMATQVNAELIVSSPSNETLCSRISQRVVVVGPDFFTNPKNKLFQFSSIYPKPSSILYVIFTSGSTGTPKGVQITHGNLASAIYHQAAVREITAASRVFEYSSYSFDACVSYTTRTLVAGGCLCVPSEDHRRDMLAESIRSSRATLIDLTPSVLRTLDPTTVPGLRTLVLGGEQLHLQDIMSWWKRLKVLHTYGPAECTPVSTINSTAAGAQDVLNIGKGAGVVTWVVNPDNHDCLASLGDVGELLLEGPLVGAGYINDPVMTAAKFIQDPPWLLTGAPGMPGRRGRLYKTGDLVRFKEDGSLVFVGRKDTQVKIRGQRVELAEVEHHVQKCMPSATSVVAEIINPGQDASAPVLAVFLQGYDHIGKQEGTKFEATEVVHISHQMETILAENLPLHMVPAVFISIAKLPMTPSGKTDRRRLREIGGSFTIQQLAAIQTRTQEKKRQPSTDREHVLQKIWAEILKIDQLSIGVDDSFLRLGGDSIGAIQVSMAARAKSIKISTNDVLKKKTISNLVRGIPPSAETESGQTSMHQASEGQTTQSQQRMINKPGGNSTPTLDDSKCLTAEQSFAQERLWFLHKLYPGLCWYLVRYALRLRGNIDLDALNTAVMALEHRHETLRTTFSSIDGVNVQIVRAFEPKELKVVDLSSYSDEQALNVLRIDQKTTFDLETEPGWRVTVFKRHSDDHILSIVGHHINLDGWSMELLRRDLARFYSFAIRGQDPLSQVDPLPIQYREYSMWEKHRSNEYERRRQMRYWAKQLEGSRPAELFCDKPRPKMLSGRAGVNIFQLPDKLYGQLQKFCQERELTPFVVLLATFRATLYRLTGAEDATIAIANANRDRTEFKDMIGFFVNVQAIRLHVSEETFQELVQQTGETMESSFANQDVPFERIVSELRVDRDLSRNPLVQIALAYHSPLYWEEFQFEGIQAEKLNPEAVSGFDLEFHIYREQNGIRGEVEFSTDLYGSETISSMISIFCKILRQGLQEPMSKIATLSLFDNEDFDMLDKMGLMQVSQTDFPRESSIPDVFRRQVALSPERIAVKDSFTQLTYMLLDEYSDMIAHWLSRRHLRPETLVGVFADRSCHTIAALLGILKANLAYLPFDTLTPVARMDAILSSIQGNKLVLVGPRVSTAGLQLDGVELARIEDILAFQTPYAINAGPDSLSTPSPTSLAYVMFTSGSTGKPKGVMIEHRSVLRLVKDKTNMRGLPSAPVVAHMSNLAFDMATHEIYVSLLNGGTLLCIPRTDVVDHMAVEDIFVKHKVNVMTITPSLLKQYLVNIPDALRFLSMTCVGGEAPVPDDMTALQGITNGTVINGYGPTENTMMSTAYYLKKHEQYANRVPIGRAVNNSGAYVMDSKQRLVPIGVVGELVVTGDGLARGYTDPQAEVGKFVEVEVCGKYVRAYLTGDFVRCRPLDGELEYLGRLDGQVKIRGQRVELREIEHILRSHESVSEATVTTFSGDNRGNKVAAFITLKANDGSDDTRKLSGEESERVNIWTYHFDSDVHDLIPTIKSEDVGRDFIGWRSSYDGGNLDRTEMSEWLDDTIKSILNSSSCCCCHRPAGNILEIGTGTGMILFNLADNLESYLGLEPSRQAVDFVREIAKSTASLGNKVEILQGSAADIGNLQCNLSPELVIMNSVVQYFPGQDYLLGVLRDLLQIKSIKTIFIGDVRSYALHKEFLVSKLMYTLGENVEKKALRTELSQLEQMEPELLIDPSFFTSLLSHWPDQIEHVEILPKRMHATNELSCYRYAAVIHIKVQDPIVPLKVCEVGPEQWIDFTKCGLDSRSLSNLIQRNQTLHPIAISNIPDQKSVLEMCIVDSLHKEQDEDTDTLGGWLSKVKTMAKHRSSLSAMDLVKLGEETGYRVEISCARQFSQRGGLDAIFYLPKHSSSRQKQLFSFPFENDKRSRHMLSSQPLHQLVVQKTQEDVLELLKANLPSYMVPSSITVLERLPLNENGKVDLRALAKFEHVTKGETPVQPPMTDTERQLERIWCGILNLEPGQFGLHDSFFQLGGDSMSAMQVLAAARRSGINISAADMINNATLSQLAAASNKALSKQAMVHDKLDNQAWCVSPFQRMLLDHHLEDLHHFNWSSLLRLRRHVSADIMQEALSMLTARHPMLRACFYRQNDGLWRQYIGNEARLLSFAEHHVPSLEHAKPIARNRRSQLDIAQGPLFTADLINIEGQRQMILFTAHYLVVDLVSWRIMWTDLDEYIRGECRHFSTEHKFRIWCQTLEGIGLSIDANKALPFAVKNNFEYWGVSPPDNINSASLNFRQVIEKDMTSLLLGKCNDTLLTEPLDVMVAVLIHSLHQMFPSRDPPTLFLEGHGREALDGVAIDLSETIGWFSTMYPIQIELDKHHNVRDAVKLVKAVRRMTPHNGVPYFARRFMSDEGSQEFQDHSNIELAFSYMGIYRQLETKESLFIPTSINMCETASDAPRMALIEVNCSEVDGQLQFSVSFHKQMKYQEKLHQWVRSLSHSFRTAIHELSMS